MAETQAVCAPTCEQQVDAVRLAIQLLEGWDHFRKERPDIIDALKASISTLRNFSDPDAPLLALQERYSALQQRFDKLFESQDVLRETNTTLTQRLETARRANNDLRETVERLKRQQAKPVRPLSHLRPPDPTIQTIWVTTDGEEFTRRDEAQAHQASLNAEDGGGDNEQPQLAPCPMCGWRAILLNRRADDYEVICARTRDGEPELLPCGVSSGSYGTPQAAAMVWNRRCGDDG